jgi:peptide/nickel transport system permease protein
VNVRIFRTFILDEVNQDYVRTARAKGLNEKLVLFKHVLKNAMIPVITYVVIEIPFLITGSFLLESFFGIPGLGSITIDAIHNSDFPVIKAMTTIETLLFIFANLSTDLLYSVVDPRVRLS